MTGYNEFCFVKLTFRSRTTPATTKDYYFSNREIINDSEPFKYYPLLKSYNVGGALSNYVPRDNVGSVILDNQYSNLMQGKRISDLLQDWEIIGQTVEFYESYNEDLTANASLIWRDQIAGSKYNANNKTITLNCKSNVLPKHNITYEIEPDWLNMPQGSIGKPLPLVIGEDVEVKPIVLGDSGSGGTIGNFGYATIFDDDFVVGGVQKYKAKDDNGNYKQIANPASASTSFYQWSNDASGGYIPLHDGEMASRINYDSANIYIATAIRIRVEGASANVGRTIEGEIVARIYKRREDTGKPSSQAIQEIRLNKADYSTEIQSTSEWILTFPLEKPLVMSHTHGYFVSLQCTQSPDNGLLRASTRNESGRVVQFRNDPSRDNKDSWQAGTQTSGTTQETAKTFIMSFRGVFFTDYPSSAPYTNKEGLSLAYFNAVSEGNFMDTQFNLMDLDLIVEVNGIIDNAGALAGGGYTGIITACTHIIKLITYQWNGSTWTDSGLFISSLHSSTHVETENGAGTSYLRVLTGRTTGTTRADKLITDLAREMQMLVCPTGDRRFGLFFIGTTSSASQTIYLNEMKTLTYAGSDQGTIVNSALAFYDKKVEDQNKGLDLIDLQKRNYGSYLSYRFNDGGTGQAISANSYNLYGERQLAKKEFDWIANSTHMANVLKVILRRHDIPPQFITFEIPYFKVESGDVVSMDIGTVFNVATPELPSDDGTTTDNSFNPENKANTQESGSYRADLYKCQLVNREHVKAENEMMIIRYTAKLITSSNDVT
jgi:hypothetical protein